MKWGGVSYHARLDNIGDFQTIAYFYMNKKKVDGRAWKRGNTEASWRVTQMGEMSKSGSWTKVESFQSQP